jgi:transposase
MKVIHAIIVPMYIDIVPNRNSKPAVLLRQAQRQGKTIVKKTLANLSHWPDDKVARLRALLRDEPLCAPEECFQILRSLPHGHVQALMTASAKLGLERLLDAKHSRQRSLVLGMILQRLIHPRSKLATSRLWEESSLGRQVGARQVDVDELYEALSWLLERQDRIQRKLARRHLAAGATALYDVSSSYYEGRCCPLARHGHDRDGKGRPIIVYGLLSDARGCPISIQVYPGNTADPKTVPDQVDRLRGDFELSRVVLVGDRGMLTSARIEDLRKYPALGWISCLRSQQIRGLVETGPLQLSLFDQSNLAEISAPQEFPGERLVACLNPLLAAERARKREELLQATEKLLEKIRLEAERHKKTPLSRAQLGLKAGKVLGRYKMGKHFKLEIQDGRFAFTRHQAAIDREAALDGIYVIRTSEPSESLSAADAVRGYKSLSQVEAAFRTLKGVDLRVRPIFHRSEDAVRAHLFLCFLAYYLEWHLRRAWRSLLFADEELEQERKRRDPVAPAKPSAAAKLKKIQRMTADGLALHSFETLMIHLGTQCLSVCRLQSDSDAPTFDQVTLPTPLQKRAFDLLETDLPRTQ